MGAVTNVLEESSVTQKKQVSGLDKFFGVTAAGSSIKVEIMAGLTTFFAMAYIIFVNPNILNQFYVITGDTAMASAVASSVFVATCLSAFIGTLLMAVYAKVPFAQASGMGLNAFFAYTVMLGNGYSYNQALAIVFISGVLFILITLLGLREAIYRAIPKNVRIAISAGIGMFITLIGLLNAGVVIKNDATTIGMCSFNVWNSATAAALLCLLGLIITGVLMKLKVKGAILISIVACTLIGIPMGVTQVEGFTWTLPDFGAWVNYGLFKLDFSGIVDMSHGLLGGIFSIIMIVLSFSLVDMFDTIGTLVGTANKAGMIDKDGNMPRMRQAMMSDAIATAAGALMGTSTVTTYVESSTGISEGGRTGLTSLTTAVLFLLALFLAPLVGIVPSAATAPAFIIVGVMMLSSIKSLELDDMTEAIPAFLTIVMMPFAYSIATGIAFGLISYTLLKVLSGRAKEVSPVTAVLAIIFIIRFACMAA